MNSRDLGKEFGHIAFRGRDVAALMFVLEAQREDSDLDEITLAENADLFPVWDEHWTGRRGSIVLHNGVLYQSIHDVGAGQNTNPAETPSMWTPRGRPGEEFPQWIQPLGAHDAYATGDKVMHNGKRWISLHNNNVWAPGVRGWDEWQG